MCGGAHLTSPHDARLMRVGVAVPTRDRVCRCRGAEACGIIHFWGLCGAAQRLPRKRRPPERAAPVQVQECMQRRTSRTILGLLNYVLMAWGLSPLALPARPSRRERNADSWDVGQKITELLPRSTDVRSAMSFEAQLMSRLDTSTPPWAQGTRPATAGRTRTFHVSKHSCTL